MKQRNWSVDISEARKDFGFAPKVDLKEGGLVGGEIRYDAQIHDAIVTEVNQGHSLHVAP